MQKASTHQVGHGNKYFHHLVISYNDKNNYTQTINQFIETAYTLHIYFF